MQDSITEGSATQGRTMFRNSPARSRRLHVACVAAALSVVVPGALSAQVVAPAPYRSLDANSLGQIAGVAGRIRQQFVLHEGELRGFAGASIQGLRFRRDAMYGEAYRALSARLEVFVEEASVAPHRVSHRFAANRPNAAPRFVGVLNLPASPMLSGPPTWLARDTARIPLATPLPFRAGRHLCVEIRGEPIAPQPNQDWPIDYVHDADFGTADYLGRGCGAVGAYFREPLIVNSHSLVPGGTLELTVGGRPATSSVLMFGAALQPAPVALDPIGMTGCVLRIDPVAGLGVQHSISRSTARFPIERVPLPLPRDGSLGARFHLQAVNLEQPSAKSNRLGLTVTNALTITLPPSVRPTRWVTVQTRAQKAAASWPTSGVVYVGYGPVMRIE